MNDSGLISALICFLGVLGFGRIFHRKRDGWWWLSLSAALALASALATHDAGVGWPLAAVVIACFGAVGLVAWRAQKRRP